MNALAPGRDTSTRYSGVQVAVLPSLAIVYKRTYIMVEFEWDPRKAAANLRKHGVDFADATEVLFDESALTITDFVQEEERVITIGSDAMSRVLVVVYTWRGTRVRLISARRATRLERRQYEDHP